MADQQKGGNACGHAVLVAALTLTTWAFLSYGVERFASMAADEFYLHAAPAPHWSMDVLPLYMLSPSLTLGYLPAVAALAVCVSLVMRRSKTLTLRTIFIGLTLVCVMLAILGQAQNVFYTAFPIFVIVHTSFSIGLTIWLVRELGLFIDALSKTHGD